MFTGIITDIGTVSAAEQRGDLRLGIRCGYTMSTIDLGASIACSGVCLTVVDKSVEESDPWFAVDISAETLSRTAPGLWTQGARLNLERPLKVGDELGGHFVTGHVDCIGEVVEARPEGGSNRIAVSVPASLAPMVAAKGSIALDGVSLTVNEVRESDDGSTLFSVNVIPHTAEHTTLGQMSAGRQLNVEIDVLARYIDRMVAAKTQ
jgi:riboflavin synthase